MKWGGRGLGRGLHLHGRKGAIISTGHRPCSVAASMTHMLWAMPATHFSVSKPNKSNGSPELVLVYVYLSLLLGP